VSTASSLEITLNSKISWAVSHASHSRSGTGRHGGHPSQDPQSLKAMAKKTQRLCASARDHSARKATAHTGLP
jgi:hypothetical protein